MYLKMLNEEQKELFLNFAYKLAMADWNYDEKEQILMKSYCDEMKIKLECINSTISIEEIVEKAVIKFGEMEKKIFIFESIVLAMTDNFYHEKEKNMILFAMKKMEIPEAFHNACEELISTYMELQNKMNQVIFGE